MTEKNAITAAGLARAKVDPALLAALAESIERLADKALPAPWADLLKDYGILCRAEAGGRIYPADFAEYTQRYTEAVYYLGEAEAAQDSAALAVLFSAHTDTPKGK